MKTVRFCCRACLAEDPDAIAEQILDVGNWTDFQGYGLLPGIRSAEFERRTPEVVGSRIRVCNTDGSTHVEEITEWDPPRRLQLKLGEFSPPVSALATHFEETWEFDVKGSETVVRRSMQLFPKSSFSWPLLYLISFPLKKAIARHLTQLQT